MSKGVKMRSLDGLARARRSEPLRSIDRVEQVAVCVVLCCALSRVVRVCVCVLWCVLWCVCAWISVGVVCFDASIAQLGERQTEDLKVPGSIPGRGIFYLLLLLCHTHATRY